MTKRERHASLTPIQAADRLPTRYEVSLYLFSQTSTRSVRMPTRAWFFFDKVSVSQHMSFTETIEHILHTFFHALPDIVHNRLGMDGMAVRTHYLSTSHIKAALQIVDKRHKEWETNYLNQTLSGNFIGIYDNKSMMTVYDLYAFRYRICRQLPSKGRPKGVGKKVNLDAYAGDVDEITSAIDEIQRRQLDTDPQITTYAAVNRIIHVNDAIQLYVHLIASELNIGINEVYATALIYYVFNHIYLDAKDTTSDRRLKETLFPMFNTQSVIQATETYEIITSQPADHVPNNKIKRGGIRKEYGEDKLDLYLRGALTLPPKWLHDNGIKAIPDSIDTIDEPRVNGRSSVNIPDSVKKDIDVIEALQQEQNRRLNARNYAEALASEASHKDLLEQLSAAKQEGPPPNDTPSPQISREEAFAYVDDGETGELSDEPYEQPPFEPDPNIEVDAASVPSTRFEPQQLGENGLDPINIPEHRFIFDMTGIVPGWEPPVEWAEADARRAKEASERGN